jgi:hemerythrin-like domain-containing protein
MALVTQPLRDEHRELFPHIEHLRTVADSIGEAPPDGVREAVGHCAEFLARHLLPHAKAEEEALYPVVGRLLGAPEATQTMSRDHVEIAKLTAELQRLSDALQHGEPGLHDVKDLRRVLYGLYAVVTLHFAEEEEIYLRVLDERLSPQEAQQMFESMGHAAHEANPSA